MPQSSRMMVTLRAVCSHRMTSACCSCACAGSAKSALLASSSIDRNGGSRCEREMDSLPRVYLYRSAGYQVQVRAGRHPRGDRGVEAGRLVIDRDEPLLAARERDRVGAVVPPVIDVAARHDVAEAHHLQD